MSNFVPNSHHLREVLLHYFISKKTAAESHRILVKVHDEHASLEAISTSAKKTVENH